MRLAGEMTVWTQPGDGLRDTGISGGVQVGGTKELLWRPDPYALGNSFVTERWLWI